MPEYCVFSSRAVSAYRRDSQEPAAAPATASTAPRHGWYAAGRRRKELKIPCERSPRKAPSGARCDEDGTESDDMAISAHQCKLVVCLFVFFFFFFCFLLPRPASPFLRTLSSLSPGTKHAISQNPHCQRDERSSLAHEAASNDPACSCAASGFALFPTHDC